MIFCIPKQYVNQIKESALKSEIDLEKLSNGTTAERRAFFEKHVGPEMAKFLNTKFEQALARNTLGALKDFAKSIVDPKAKGTQKYERVLKKIKYLEEKEAFDPKMKEIILEDLVSEKLGLKVTPEEIFEIKERAEKIDEKQKSVGDNFGSLDHYKETEDFLLAKKEMDDYLLKKTPSNFMKILIGSYGRNAMLAGINQPVLNIIQNIETGLTEALAKRMANWQFTGTSGKLAKEYVENVKRLYKKTGYDVSRMMTIGDTEVGGGRVMGKMTHAQGKGVFRKGASIMNDVIGKYSMGYPDVVSASVQFADTVNLLSKKLSKDQSKREYFMKDAMKVTPETMEGQVLRQQAILDAQVATFTNQSWTSSFAEGTRNLVNKVTGDVGVGDFLFPFVKTASNIANLGMQYSGGGFVNGSIKLAQAVRKGNLKDPSVKASLIKDFVRPGMGMLAAYIIAQNIDDKDFQGAYDPSKYQLGALTGKGWNSLNIKGKSISIDYLPVAIGMPLAAMMYARKYKGAEKGWGYAKGVGSVMAQMPVVSDLVDFSKELSYSQNKSLQEATGEFGDYIARNLMARLVPSIIPNIAATIDKNERVQKTTSQKLAAKIPFLRQTLPEKINVFGEKEKGRGISNLFFGSRVKSTKESPVLNELSRLSSKLDKGINFTDWDRSTSKKIAQFKSFYSKSVFEKAKEEYGELLKKKLEEQMNSSFYKKQDDVEKLKLINDLDRESMEGVFRKHGFRYRL